MFFIMVAPIYMPPSRAQVFFLLHIFMLPFDYSHPYRCEDVKWYLTVNWICIFLIINNTEHLFLFLLAICVFFGKKSIHFLCSFHNWILCFVFFVLFVLMLSCMSSLYSFDINVLLVGDILWLWAFISAKICKATVC